MAKSFAQKTMRGVSSTFGTLADTLHLPDSMRCCGVGAIEAQIAAGGDDDDVGSTSDDSIFAIRKGGRKNKSERSSRSKAQSSKGGTSNKTTAKLPADRKGGGGLRGMLSSARSLGWGKRKGGREDDRSQNSQASGLSFLSGGLKMLSSASKSLFNSFRPSSAMLDEGTSEASSDLTSLGETESSEGDEIARRAVVLWRHVRMVVRGVRGTQRAVGGGSRLKETVAYQAARRVQGMVRIKLARKATVALRITAIAALKRGEELRLQRRRREVDARNRYKKACKVEGGRILDWSVKVVMQPRAIVDLQRVWRGYRARKRLTAYLKWLEDRARRRREYQRYLAALAAKRGAAGREIEQVKRRVWGRVEFSHTGWRPRYEVEHPPNMHDHVWAPPRGSSSGVRTLKVLLPPASERDRLTLKGDKNAWAGVPVGIAKRRPPPERLGPPARPGTITAVDAERPTLPSSVGGGGGVGVGGGKGGEAEGRSVTKYNWIPAPLVGKASLLQAP
ncbi:unnamed protein product, partial [Pylaiella littoralis]